MPRYFRDLLAVSFKFLIELELFLNLQPMRTLLLDSLVFVKAAWYNNIWTEFVVWISGIEVE